MNALMSPPGQVATVSIGDRSVPLFRGQQIRIGREPSCDLVASDPRVSRIHVTVSADVDGTVSLEDLGGANGTHLGVNRIAECTVDTSATFSLGSPNGEPLNIALESLARHPYPPPPPPVSPHSAGHDTPSPAAGTAEIHLTGADLARLGEITIGRAPDNAIVLNDPLVSRNHARLTRTDAGYQAVDLGSLNGLHLNGRAVESGAVMSDGDRLRIGRTTLSLIDGGIVSGVPERAALSAKGLTFVLPNGRELLKDVSFDIAPSQLVAVIGPSGAGKSTLLKAITGTQPATQGEVVYMGQDLYRSFASLRPLIGVVPQDDVVHRQLTVAQALGYAAELRLPEDYDKTSRDAEVQRAIADLGLGAHQDTPISRLSGGQRKRTSVAMELLTQPPLLLLDEPTSGLDPGLDLDVMQLLRTQASGGRTVLVVTHSTDNLSLCDQVLILAPGGLVAYYGPPQGVLGHFGSRRYAEVFKGLADDPNGHAHRWAQTAPSRTSAEPADSAAIDGPPRKRGIAGPLSTLIRRQLRIISADRSYAASTILLPLVVALMALVIPGDSGFGPPAADEPRETNTLLVIITVGAAFMGMAASIRELITERPIFLRERTVGLSTGVYLSAKIGVLFLLTLIQSALFIALIRVGKPGPEDAIWAPDATVELWLAAFGTAFASAMLGLMVSALVGTGEQTMPALVITVMAQLVFCGGLITITDRAALEVVGAVFPSRWGFAQGAATVDLTQIVPSAPQDTLWEHTPTAWVTSALALAGISAVAVTVTAIRLVRQRSST